MIQEITESLNEGSIPSHLRWARLVPLSKVKGSAIATIQDIRPIMIKSHIFKIMEKVLLQKIKSTRSNLLRSGQYQNGFKERRSTCNNLAQVVQRIHGKDRN